MPEDFPRIEVMLTEAELFDILEARFDTPAFLTGMDKLRRAYAALSRLNANRSRPE